ncbi:MAG: proprotein convertase P-domain-containing protein [Lewinellaceae bacterium]|nr:proprotein convertase P-domain-containing protein [Saprospiraceae bacterium]MCB9331417.1 proprotein convertase P-domain-containing protein [Lewinellaceae bacterium]
MLKQFLCILLLPLATNLVAQNLWIDFPEKQIPANSATPRYIIPSQYRTVRLNLDQLKPTLAAAPQRFSTAAAEQAVILGFPMPDGSTSHFQLTESPVMAPALQAKYPDIRCYTGTGIEDPSATLKCDLTPQGFHAMIQSKRFSTVFIDPYRQGDVEHCIVYFKKDFQSKKQNFSCEVDAFSEDLNTLLGSDQPEAQGDCTLRRYRLALACTGEYADFHGGTKPLVLAAMNTTMNRVNGIYERDFAITMQLIANNDTLIYLNSATDGYSNGNGSTMLGQNQTKCNTIIGSANYDIGHVLSTGGGGVAGLGVVCRVSSKAQGVTGLSQPIGDPFDIDYVAHEMGHQFGGNHTFNSSCSGNRNPGTAFEPGSGTTIMAYAGVCSPYNVQNHSDDFFHGISLQEIGNYVTNGSGGLCPVEFDTGNDKPTVDGGGNYTIPKSTPFALTAVGMDVNGDSLTYSWEQMNNEQTTMPPVATSNSGPLFRSFSPTPSPTRYFPRLVDLVNNISPTWEVLPAVARTMNFRVNVRDNHAPGGCTGEAEIQLTVNGASGPFLVTQPNTVGTWFVGDSEMVTWDVANTDMAPVSCAEVRILLSTDGGFTYPIVLADGVPNSGSATVLVPDAVSATCRVMVQAAGNVFFDISDQNFIIENPPVPTFLLNISAENTVQVCAGDSLEFTAAVAAIAGFADTVGLSIGGMSAGATLSIAPNPLTPGNTAQLTLNNLTVPGVFPLTLTATSGAIIRTQIIELTVVDNAPAAPAPANPVDGATNQSLAPVLRWALVTNALQYQIQVATNPSFQPNTLVFDGTVVGDSVAVMGLDTATVYYWRLNVGNACGESSFSSIFAFQTGTYDCGHTFSSTDVPTNISNSGVVTVHSSLEVPVDRTIADVNVAMEVSHSWVGDLIGTLIGPDAKTTRLFDQPGYPATSSGCNGDNLSLVLDDQALQTADQLENSCGNNPAISGTFQPIAPLGSFNNTTAMGTWQLEMTDNFPEDGGAITAWSLTFCFLDTVPSAQLLVNNPLLLPTGGTGTFSENNLELSITSAVPDDGIFTLLSLPQHGELQLNGLPLGIGDVFSQADIIIGSVTYVHNGDAAATDAFLFDAVDASSNGWVHAATFDIIILQNDLNVAAELTQGLLCNNDSTAQISVSVAGGTMPFEYSLNGGLAQSGNTFDNLPAGNYTVVISDFFGFTAETNTIVIDNPAAIDVTAGVTDDDITVQVAGGAAPLEYSLDGQTFQPEPVFENLPNGNYTITVQDANGCTGTATALVDVPPLTAELTIETPIGCNGDSDGTLAVTVAGGVGPYVYSLDGQTFQSENTFSGLSAGTYTVTVQDDSGNTSTTNAILLNDPPVIAANATATLNSIAVAATGGTGAYMYSLDGQNFQADSIFENLLNGNYIITVQDANGCTATTTATVDVPPLVIADVTITGTILCPGETVSLLISADGGVPPYQFSLDGGAYQSDSLFENVAGGIHTVTLLDAAGTMVQIQTVSIVEPDPLSAVVTSTGNDIFVQGQGGTAPYLYALDNGVPQPDGNFPDLANGPHELVIIDANGCTATSTFVLDYTPLSVSAVGTDPGCAGTSDGAIDIAVSGGTPPYECDQNGQPCSFSDLSAGVYTYLLMDGLGDTLSISVTLTDPPVITASASVSSDTITITASGGTGSLQYSLDGVTYQSEPVFPAVPNGTYTLWVQDANGCTFTIDDVVVDFVGTVSPEAAWGLRVSPNPGSGLFQINLLRAPAGTLRTDVFDAAGRLILAKQFEPVGNTLSGSLDLRSVPAGVYWLRLTSGNEVGAVRLVVARR